MRAKAAVRLFLIAGALACGALIGRYAPAIGVLKPQTAVDLHQYRSPQYAARLSLFATISGAADIVMLGDSITEFGEWKELFPHASILNRGIGGDTTDGVLARLDEVVGRQPKLVFLMIGINDLDRGSPVSVVEQNIAAIKAALGKRLILQSILLTSNAKLNAKVAALNSALRNDETFVDLNIRLAPNGTLLPEYTWDGIHLTGPAYVKWRDTITPLIN